MNDIAPLKDALFQAHTAGDFKSAEKIAAKIRELQSGIPNAITADIQQAQEPDINEGLSFLDKSLISFGRSGDKLYKGMQQLYHNTLGDPEEAERIRGGAEENNRLWQKHATSGMKAGEVAGDIGLALMPLSAAGKTMQAANIGLKTRMAAQAGLGASQDYLYQKGEGAEDIDLGRTALSAGLSGAAEGLSPLISRAYAQLTVKGKQAMDRGVQVIKDSGADPNDFPVEKIMKIGQDAAKLSDKVKPSAIAAQAEFDLPMTRGQMTGDRGLQMAEYDLKGTAYGEPLKKLENKQYEAIEGVLHRLQDKYSQGTRQIDGPYSSGEIVSDAINQGAEQLNRSVSDAYQSLNQSKAFLDKQAFTGLSDRALKAVSKANILVDDLTPSTRSTVQHLSDFTQQLGDNVKSVSIKKVENLRRVINNQINKTTGTDKKAVITIKNEFDNWLDESVTNGLMSGDPDVYKQLRQARGLRAEYAKKFESDKFIKAVVDGEKTADEVVNYMVGVGKIGARGNAVKAIQTLKNTLGEDHQAISALKESVVIKLIENKGVTALASDLGNAVTRGAKGYNYMRELFSPSELAELSRFKQAVDHLVPEKEMVNHSNSAYVILRQLSEKITGMSFIQNVARSADATTATRPLLTNGPSLASKVQAAPVVGAFTNREGQGISHQF